MSLRILFIDDNQDDRLLAIRVLTRHFDQLEVDEVDDPASLAAAIEGPACDAVILDYRLGWTTGLEVLEQLKSRHPLTPVIMFTNTGSEEVCVQGMRRGLFDYILKRPEYYVRLPIAVQSALEFTAAKVSLAANENALRERAAELAESNRRKDEFLAMLAHELRNPLAAIGNAATLLDLASAEEQAPWAKEIIQRQVKHLARLVDDLLDASRITQGKIELQRELVDVRALLTEAVETVRPSAAERQQNLQLSIEPGELWLKADPVRLEQIVANLLSNAVKFTPSAGRIWLEAGREGEEVVIRVRDNGIGISPQSLAKVFELFTQEDQSLSRCGGGLGIGLTIVDRLVRLHGGSVTATSEGIGQGSEFVVRLPAAMAPAGANLSGRDRGAAATKGSKVLIVEDNIDAAMALFRLVKILGHTVEMVHNGTAAVELARTFRPDVVLLDIGLPGINGYEVADRLRNELGLTGSLIVAVSGYGQDEDRTRSLAAGCNHHLVKPVDFQALFTLINAAGQEAPS